MNPRRERLAGRLREVRAAASRSGNAFARQLGWVQSRVSKLETGTQLPTEDDIRQWVVASAAGPEVEAELLDLLAAARVEYVNVRDLQRTGMLADRQASLGLLELRARHVREFQPLIIPGLLQTAAYARELLALPGGPRSHGATDVEAVVAERIRRQAVLYEPERRIELIVGETALYSAPGSPATLHGQLDRLLAVAGLDNLLLGVLPTRGPMAVLSMNGFTLHDDDLAVVETTTAELRLDEPGEVGVYREAFDHLWAAAATGADALRLVRRAMTAATP